MCIYFLFLVYFLSFAVDFVLKDPREQDDENKDEIPDYKLEYVSLLGSLKISGGISLQRFPFATPSVPHPCTPTPAPHPLHPTTLPPRFIDLYPHKRSSADFGFSSFDIFDISK